jgi:hypothetical protein
MSEAYLERTARSDSPRHRDPLWHLSYVATATETIKNYAEDWAGAWFKEDVDADDPAGNLFRR